MYLTHSGTQKTAKTPPLKRLRVGRKLLHELTDAVNSPATASKAHPLGDMLKQLRIDAGAAKRYQFASVLGMTDQTLQKLESQPLKSGSQPMFNLLESFGLALTLEVPGLDISFGYPELHEAFFALRCRNADLTQRELCVASGVARSTLQNFESGKPIKLSMLLKMVSAMGARVMMVPADQVKAGIVADDDSSNETQHRHDPVSAGTNTPPESRAPSLADKADAATPPSEQERADRIARANVKRAPWYWDGARRRWPVAS